MNPNSVHGRNRGNGAQAKARAILEFALTDEWQPAEPLKQRITKQLDCHARSVYRAAESLGVEHRYPTQTKAEWRLPQADES